MAQELDPQPVSLMRAFDQAGDVSHDKRPFFAIAYDSQMRGEGSKREVRYPRAGRRDGREQGRFSGVRKPDQTHIGQQAEFELQSTLFPGQAGLSEPGGLVRRGSKESVAFAT